MARCNNKRILIDYYVGADGPTLRLDVQSKQSLDGLRSLFLDLASKKRTHIRLHKFSPVRMTSRIKAIHLILEANTRSGKLELHAADPDGAVFRWWAPSEVWTDYVGLIDGLVGPGHQYLAGEAHDDAIVELAFMEAPLHTDEGAVPE